MSLAAFLREQIARNPDTDSEILAARIVRQRECRDELAHALAREIDHMRRETARGVEAHAFRRFFEVQRAGGAPCVAESLRAVFREKFALGDGSVVEWGRATIDQHRARVAILSRQRAGIEATIARHEAAIELIASHGATCLDEVGVAA